MWNAVTVPLAFGALLSSSLQLMLRERSADPLKEPGRSIAAVVAALSTVFLVAAALNWLGGAEIVPAFTLAFLMVGVPLGTYFIGRYVGSRERPEVPTQLFEEVVLSYARRLSESGKDKALLELRKSLTRTLHLNSQHSARRELGLLALRAAQRQSLPLEEASILVDDLGWSSVELQDFPKALKYLSDAEMALGDVSESATSVALRIKLLRHRSVVLATSDFRQALDELQQARMLIPKLPVGDREIEDAGLDVGEGYVWVLHLESDYGAGARLPQTNPVAEELDVCRELLVNACDKYEKLGDVERAAKTAAIEARIAKHLGNERAEQAALGRLERYQAAAARSVERWLGA